MGNCGSRNKKPLTISLDVVKDLDTFSDKYKAKGGNTVSCLKRHKDRELFCRSYEKKKLDKFSEIALFENLDIMRMELGYHPSFLKLIDFCDTMDEYKLIVEMYDGIDCCSYLRNKIKRSDENLHRLVGMVIQMVYTSLKFLHGKSLLHNDVRLSNILVSKHWSPDNYVFKSTSYFKLKGYRFSRVAKKQNLYHRLWSLSSNAFSDGSSPKLLSPVKSSPNKGKAESYKPYLTIVTGENEVEVDSSVNDYRRSDEREGEDKGEDMNSRKTNIDIYIDPILINDPAAARNQPFAADLYAFGILIKELCTYSWCRRQGKRAEEIDDWREDLLPFKSLYEQLTNPQISDRPMKIESLESMMIKRWEDCWVKEA